MKGMTAFSTHFQFRFAISIEEMLDFDCVMPANGFDSLIQILKSKYLHCNCGLNHKITG